MKILIIGSGMYVTGRDNTGTGTILSSLAQTSKTISIQDVVVVSKSDSSAKGVEAAAARINKLLKSGLKVSFRALKNNPLSKITELHSKNKFDIAIIAIPDHLHFEYAKIVLELGINCLVVKPLTPTYKEASDLIAIQNKNKVYAAVEFHKRWDETNIYIKKALANKVLGKINYFSVDYSQRIDIPLKTFKTWASQTNIFQYLGVHYVDLICFLTNFIPVKVMAYGTDGILKEKGIDTYDSVHASIVWRNPTHTKDCFISMFNTNWIDPNVTSALSDQKYKVVGTLGRIECDQKNRGVELVTDLTGIQQINPYFSDYLPDENGELKFGGYGHKSIERFILDVMDIKNKRTTVKKLETTRPTFQSSLASTAVVEAVNKSLKKGNDWTKIVLE